VTTPEILNLSRIGVFSIVAVGVNAPLWASSSVDGAALRPSSATRPTTPKITPNSTSAAR
jgi:hypothetical protein